MWASSKCAWKGAVRGPLAEVRENGVTILPEEVSVGSDGPATDTVFEVMQTDVGASGRDERRRGQAVAARFLRSCALTFRSRLIRSVTLALYHPCGGREPFVFQNIAVSSLVRAGPRVRARL